MNHLQNEEVPQELQQSDERKTSAGQEVQQQDPKQRPSQRYSHRRGQNIGRRYDRNGQRRERREQQNHLGENENQERCLEEGVKYRDYGKQNLQQRTDIERKEDHSVASHREYGKRHTRSDFGRKVFHKSGPRQNQNHRSDQQSTWRDTSATIPMPPEEETLDSSGLPQDREECDENHAKSQRNHKRGHGGFRRRDRRGKNRQTTPTIDLDNDSAPAEKQQYSDGRRFGAASLSVSTRGTGRNDESSSGAIGKSVKPPIAEGFR